MHITRRKISVLFIAFAAVCALYIARSSATEKCTGHCQAPDEEALGKKQGYPIATSPFGILNETYLVGSFSNMDKVFPVNLLRKGHEVRQLDASPIDPGFRYIDAGKNLSIDDYLNRHRITGLLIIKDGRIALERYQYDRAAHHKMTSASMAKSITSIAVGIAHQEGKIRSLDDKLAVYVPELTGYTYGETTIRNILRMASGVKYNEDYAALNWGDFFAFAGIMRQQGSLMALKAFDERAFPQGDRFNYSSLDTQALGQLIRSATGQTVSDYLARRLWQPLGAESDANWVVSADGTEEAYGHFSATLRDYGRLGWLLANDGYLDGKQIVPKDYLIEATSWQAHPEKFAPIVATPFYGYGYQFWLFPGKQRQFALRRKYGQSIFVNPELKLVMVQTAVSNIANTAKDPLTLDVLKLWGGLVQYYSRN